MPKFRMFSSYLDEGIWEDLYAEDERQALDLAWEAVQSRLEYYVEVVEEVTKDD